MYASARCIDVAALRIGDVCRIGHAAADRQRVLGTVAPRDHRLEARRVERHLAIEAAHRRRMRSARQSRTARSHAAPCGANGRPARYANVVSSGAIMPARAPASIDMLHSVKRPSIDSARTVEPAYSIA